MPKLRRLDFQPCWDAAGVRGWGGEGYWFHHQPLVRHWFDFTGSTRVSKTTTMYINEGHMPLKGYMEKYAPKEKYPRCIWWDFMSGRTLNAVGLAGPGAHELTHLLFWNNWREPCMISFMSVRRSMEDRLDEFRAFADFFMAHLRGTQPLERIALQINISCPNTGLETGYLLEEAKTMLDISSKMPVPKVLKINILAPTKTIAEIAEHAECDALCFTNALPFGSKPDDIDWESLFPNGSPLANRNKDFGGGGYSGPELLPLVATYAQELRRLGVHKPFNVGGGIRSARDVEWLVKEGGLKPGHDSIFFASAAMVRPWRIRSIIRKAHELLG